jgi:hypothetical protein
MNIHARNCGLDPLITGAAPGGQYGERNVAVARLSCVSRTTCPSNLA